VGSSDRGGSKLIIVGVDVFGKVKVAFDVVISNVKIFFPCESVTVTVLVLPEVATLALRVTLPLVKDSPLTGVVVSLPPPLLLQPPITIRNIIIRRYNKT
jgi:hypothetical protein